jgi:hypothetical protein
MTPRRYELTDFEWSIIEPLLPNKPRGVPRADDRRVLKGGHSGALRSADDLLQPLRPVAEAGDLGPALRRGLEGL